MSNRETRRAQRSKSRPVSKKQFGRGNLLAVLIFLIPLLFGAGLVWRAQASNQPAAAMAAGDTQTATVQDASVTSTDNNASSLDASNINSYATASDVAKMNDSGIHEVDAKDLKPGDKVVLKGGRTEIVQSVQTETAPDETQVASNAAPAPSSDASSSSDDSGDEWILAPDHVPAPLPNGEPAPLPVARSGADPGFHPLDVQKREVSGDKIILTGVNPATGKQEIVIGKIGRDTVYDLGDPNSELKTGVIENVKTGDYVVTRSPVTGKNEFKQVLQTYKHLAYETITAKFADAKTGKIVDALTATPEHPFFVPHKGFVPLGQLSVGTQVVTRQEPAVVIASLETHHYPNGIPVYNFQVQDDHSYFVGQANGGLWVHTSCWPRITHGSLPAEEEGAVTNALQHIDNGTNPPWGGKWGATFKNNGDPLPTGNTYQEYYVPKGPGDLTKWGPRRLVMGSDGSAWYTWDHYGTFVQVR